VVKQDFYRFRSLDEIVDAVKIINSDYGKHSRPLRALAREFLKRKESLNRFSITLESEFSTLASLWGNCNLLTPAICNLEACATFWPHH